MSQGDVPGAGPARLNPALLGLLVAGLGVAAGFLPALAEDRGSAGPGFRLLLGWTPQLALPWSANLFLAAGLLCLPRRRYGAAARLGLIAAALGLTTAEVVAPRQLLPGYFVWQASSILLWLGARVLASQQVSPPAGTGEEVQAP